MNKDKKETKIDKLEFNTYCIFTEEKQEAKETIGLIFKDYISDHENQLKCYSRNARKSQES